MSYQHNGIVYEDDGSMRVALIPSSGPEVGSHMHDGWRRSPEGKAYVTNATPPKTPAWRHEGIAFDASGAAYVTYNSIATDGTDFLSRGRRVRSDGALYVDNGTAITDQVWGGKRRSVSGVSIVRVLPWDLPTPTEFWDGEYGVTLSDTVVASWAPRLGSHAFTQATAAAMPAYASGVLTFDGSNDYLATGAFTLNQPFTWFLVGTQITWTDADHIVNGIGANVAIFQSNGTTPNVNIFAGSAPATGNPNWPIGTKRCVVGVFNNASSLLRINNTTPLSGTTGTSNPGGITIGALNTGGSSYANVSINGFGYADSALSTSQQDQLIRSLAQRYLVSI